MRKTLPLLFLVLIIVAVAIYFSVTVNQDGTSVKSQTDYAIQDTSSVGKIFIADRLGKTVTITRDANGAWDVNGKFPARKDAVETILKTFKNIYIQRPVPKNGQEQVIRVMAGMSTKVEIYDRSDKWLKTWYVGYATMDKKGTYMVLETPEGGRSKAPFILDMRGFIGMLNTRFFTNESEWRSTGIISYPNMGLQQVEVQYPGQENQSFKITYGGSNDLKLYKYGSDEAIANFDTSMVKDYLLNYKLASFENYETGLTDIQEDSVKTQTPYQIITIKDPRQTREIKLWAKKPYDGEMEEDEVTPAKVDRERVYGSCDNGELALAQRYAWDKFRAPLSAFLKNPEK